MRFGTGSFERENSPRDQPDGVWRFGTDADVAWIRDATPPGLAITSAIPPVFLAYATIVEPDFPSHAERVHLMFEALREQSGDQWWWLGYLDTGVDDVVFPGAPRLSLYNGLYVLVQAGPQEALVWQRGWGRVGPDVVFPEDRSWLMSRLWDDDWRCLGGPAALIHRFHDLPDLEVRSVTPDEDATPPGHISI